MEDSAEVTCAHCWKVFELVLPPPQERPCELDYDCEVCCGALVIAVDEEGVATARLPGGSEE